MWVKPIPNLNSRKLSEACHAMNIRLQIARHQYDYKKSGGNYSIRCKFSGNLLYASDSLQEIADFMRIGGVYEL